jgi:hypothetical protein
LALFYHKNTCHLFKYEIKKKLESGFSAKKRYNKKTYLNYYNFNYQVKEDEMGRASSTDGGEEECI